MRKLIAVVVAAIILGRITCAPSSLAAPASGSITQEEAEGFIRSFYRDLEGDDIDKVMTHFDQTVEYYTSGPKDLPFIANVLGQYSDYYSVRSFSIGEVKLKPLSTPDRATVTFDLRSFLRNPDRDANVSGHAHVEWDLVKRDGALKITRFAGTAATEPSASPSR